MKRIVMICAILLGICAPAAADTGYVGAQLDVGAPDGAAVSIVFTPDWYWLKVPVSLTNNYFGFGWRVGATLDPINWVIGPSLTFEYGEYRSLTVSPANDALGKSGFDPVTIDYGYLNTHIGLEIGSPESVRVFIRGGYSVIWVATSDLRGFIDRDEVPGYVITSSAVEVSGVVPSVKIGMSLMLF